jgi:hypothetical protein
MFNGDGGGAGVLCVWPEEADGEVLQPTTLTNKSVMPSDSNSEYAGLNERAPLQDLVAA